MLTILGLLLAQSPPPQAPQPTAPPAQTAPSNDVRPAGLPGRSYKIGAGDILHVTVYGQDDLSQTVVVQPAGNILFPLIGTVQAADATPEALGQRIAERLSKGLIRDPQVAVTVQEYRSQVVFVVGEVSHPGTYPLGGDTSIVEILSRAGPLSTNAGSEVVVVRSAAPVDRPVLPTNVPAGGGGSARAEVLKVDMRDVQAGRLEKNLLLRPNDTVFVPPASRIYVSGEVRNPGSFAFTSGLTARQAISLAGGFNEDASKGSPHVVREISGKTQNVKVKLDDKLLPGDTVVVKAKLF
jgi:polysaccharide export outer membrane protein